MKPLNFLKNSQNHCTLVLGQGGPLIVISGNITLLLAWEGGREGGNGLGGITVGLSAFIEEMLQDLYKGFSFCTLHNPTCYNK